MCWGGRQGGAPVRFYLTSEAPSCTFFRLREEEGGEVSNCQVWPSHVDRIKSVGLGYTLFKWEEMRAMEVPKLVHMQAFHR